ncbi:ABC transporter permease [Alteromonas gilva]|uniref:ABC transporter permease n=1 Tax=Alteromonas gilva TaxID=2987522 RepID=A0ABT5L8J2_9ALTE|nr:ABC transporter permease [Alteromonas gilva]MDC8832901.1 ABC transporter permease [Alteromonas gilva]
MAAFISVWSHGLKSFLTMLGIIIGVASTIAIISVIEGFGNSIYEQFEGFGSNSLTLRSYTSPSDQLQGKFAKITAQDVDEIKGKVKGVEFITPTLISRSGESAISFKNLQTFGQVYGTTYTYKDIQNIELKSGRFLSYNDNNTRRKVAFIGDELRLKLNLPEIPDGEFIKYRDEWFKVIGVAKPKGTFFGIEQDNYLIIPYETMKGLNGQGWIPDIFLQLELKDINDLDSVKLALQTILRKQHNIVDEQDDFKIETSEQLTSGISNILSILTVVLGGIVAISLLVGGVGIMNIMLLSVTERTREIGICKAIGARRSDILLQFLMEAIIISGAGGFIGICLGYFISATTSLFIPGFPPSEVPLWSVMLASGFSITIGIFFGIVPAFKAANLNPIDALKYE